MKMRTTYRHRALVLAGATLAAGAARATTINLAFDTSSGNFPSYDPNGSKLESIANAAKDMWLGLLPESGHNYSVSVHYGSLGGNKLGEYKDIDHTITIDNDASTTWYLDPDPTDSGEFQPFTQLFYRDLTNGGANKNSLHGSIPDMLEVGAFANAVDNSPQAAGVDMLSVALHEMGHFLEIGYNLLKPGVDLPSQFVGNRTGLSSDRADESHLVMSWALMDPSVGPGVRVFPSALDLIVAAHEQNHSEIALKRLDWIGDVNQPSDFNWSHADGWVGAKAPTSSSDVAVRNNVDLDVVTPAFAHTLLVAEKSTLDLTDHLTVGLDATVSGADVLDHPKVKVESSKKFAVDRNLIISLGEVNLNGGSLDVGNLLIIDFSLFSNSSSNHSTLRGHGNVHVGGDLRNRGDIEAVGGTLKIEADPGVTLDLDGNQENIGQGNLIATKGDLEFAAPLHDSFAGNLDISGGHSVKFTGDWSFGFPSLFTFSQPGNAYLFNDTPGAAINFDACTMYVFDSTAHLRASTIRFDPTGPMEIHISNGTLALDGDVEYKGGLIEGIGTLQQNGNATVDGKITIGVDHFDWDGSGVPPTKTTITQSSSFIINADGLGAGGYGGQCDIGEDATLKVNISGGLWLINKDGKLRFMGNSTLAGSEVTCGGKIDVVKNANDIDAPILLAKNSLVTMNDNTTLNLNSPVTFGGGVVTTSSGLPDNSLIQQNAVGSVIGHHTITTGFFNWDPKDLASSDTTINEDGHLEIHAKEIGNGVTDKANFIFDRRGYGDTVTINSGRLEVHVGFEEPTLSFPNRWELNSTGEMFLNATNHGALPTVAGSPLVSRGLISGSGIFENPLQNEGMMAIGHAQAAGLIQVLDIFSQQPNGAMQFDLGGKDPGISFDQLYLKLGGSLAGELDVSLLAGFSPSLGDVFRIIQGDTLGLVSGTFATLNLPAGGWDVIYGGNFVDLRFTAVPEPSLAIPILALALLRARRRTLRRGVSKLSCL